MATEEKHCADNPSDRCRGAAVELQFAKLLAGRGRAITAAHREVIGALSLRCGSLANSSHGDIAFINAREEKVLAEIKGKYPTKSGHYGLECYRIDGLQETKKRDGYDVIAYVIWNTRCARWFYADLEALLELGYEVREGKSYFGGEVIKCKIAYFPASGWKAVS